MTPASSSGLGRAGQTPSGRLEDDVAAQTEMKNNRSMKNSSPTGSRYCRPTNANPAPSSVKKCVIRATRTFQLLLGVSGVQRQEVQVVRVLHPLAAEVARNSGNEIHRADARGAAGSYLATPAARITDSAAHPWELRPAFNTTT